MRDTNGVTARLVAHARGIEAQALPPDVVLVAKTCVLDLIGCALAGTREPLVQMLIEEAIDEGSSPSASVVGSTRKTSSRWAALINSAAAHALDFDDTLFVAPSHPIHPTAPVLPAVLALAEEMGLSGAEVLVAFISGVETQCRLGAVVGADHYCAGWHSTATLGTFGAAAACSRLLGLDEAGWRHAFGIAAAQASGLKSMFGSMTKPFQTAQAAAHGLLAARLASKGFSSDVDAIETPQGFASTHHSALRPDAIDELRDEFMVCRTVFKYHASCYFTHSAIEAVHLMKLAPDRVGHVDVFVPPQHLDVCNIAEPATGLEGKFSLRATVAMALLGDDTADPASFVDDRMRAPDLVAMRDKVTVTASPDVDGTQTRVDVRMSDGSASSELVDVGIPASDIERQWEAVATKFDRLAVPIVGELLARGIREHVRGLDGVGDVRELVALCG